MRFMGSKLPEGGPRAKRFAPLAPTGGGCDLPGPEVLPRPTPDPVGVPRFVPAFVPRFAPPLVPRFARPLVPTFTSGFVPRLVSCPLPCLVPSLPRLRAAVLLPLLALATLVVAPAPGGAQGEVHDSPLEVWLLTADRGDEVWEMFGHNALLVRDHRTGQELVWNWGLFNFGDVDFIPRFLRGTMRYTMGPAELDPFLRSYAEVDRAVYANRVHLTAPQAEALDAFIRWNYLPENRPYIYDYYRDNCSTRIRDALDLVLEGRLSARFQALETPHSYRWHSRRQVQVTGWVDQGLSFLLGMRGDRPLTAWEVMFLPVEMMEYLEAFEVEDPVGGTRPLLGERELWVPTTRDPLPPTPPTPSLLLLALGLAGGILLGWAGVTGWRRREAGAPSGVRRGVAAAVALLWGVVATALGGLLVAAWFTDHHFIQANLNLFHLNPLTLLAALLLGWVLLRGGARRTGRATEAAVVLPLALAGFSLGVALLQGVGVLRQGNLDVLFVALPLNLALARVAWEVRHQKVRQTQTRATA